MLWKSYFWDFTDCGVISPIAADWTNRNGNDCYLRMLSPAVRRQRLRTAVNKCVCNYLTSLRCFLFSEKRDADN